MSFHTYLSRLLAYLEGGVHHVRLCNRMNDARARCCSVATGGRGRPTRAAHGNKACTRCFDHVGNASRYYLGTRTC